MKTLLRQSLKIVPIVVLLVYLTAYVALSRQGRGESIRCNSDSFY